MNRLSSVLLSFLFLLAAPVLSATVDVGGGLPPCNTNNYVLTYKTATGVYTCDSASAGAMDWSVAVDHDILPDGNKTRALGDSSHRFSIGYFGTVTLDTLGATTVNGTAGNFTTSTINTLGATTETVVSSTIDTLGVSALTTNQGLVKSDGNKKLGSTTALASYYDPTSSIQTQLNAKAPLASPTFTGVISLNSANLPNETTGRVAGIDASGNLKATPMTTAAAAFNDATSSIQTQINSKLTSTGFVEGWGIVVPLATDATYPIYPGDSVARQAKSMKAKCGAGVATATFKINTTAITSLGTLAITTAYSTVVAGTGSGNDWSADTPIVVQLQTAGTCTNFESRIESTRD